MSDTEYLSAGFDINDPDTVAVLDELSLWSARIGTLLLDHIPFSRGMNVLDVGCGIGFPCLELAQQLGSSCYVVGIDPWEAGLRRMKRKRDRWGVRNASCTQADAVRIPFAENTFDFIVSNVGINNFEDADISLRECARVARHGATLVLTTNLVGHMQEFYEVFEAVLTECCGSTELNRLQVHVQHRATTNGVNEMLQRAGFETTKVHEESFSMRYLDGSALLRHSFIRLAFLDPWKEIVGPTHETKVFQRLEEKLNALASERGEIRLTIPIASVEAVKS